MNFLSWDVNVGPENVIHVRIDRPANVLLLDDINFAAFKRRGAFRYQGGRALRTITALRAPRHGSWHVVVQPLAGAVQAQIQLA